MILCCGEALIDFLPIELEGGKTAFQPFNGGSIYNVAIALGRLGRPVGFCGGLSNDFFGRQLVDGLRESQVDLTYAIHSDRATTLAFVQFFDGEPAYVFVDDGSVGRMLTLSDFPQLDDKVNALHFGSISLIHDPAGAALEALARREGERRVISFDPNIRAGQIKDRAAYMRRFEAIAGVADIIKLSDADLAWLAPDGDMAEVAAGWLGNGTSVVAITRGSRGAVAFCRAGEIECEPQQVSVADTIGAGDTFMAGLLAALDRKGLLSPQGMADVDLQTLGYTVEFASRAAAVTVSRPGANPPWDNEL